jgi:hypothetical protein
MDSFSDAFDRLKEFAQDSTLNAIVVFAAAVALATAPVAFAVMGSQKWFQARRGRTLQRPAFGTVVVATLLVMGIPAILLAMMVKSQYYDRDRYEFDPNRTLSVLDQGRQYEAQKLRVSLEKADAALRVEEQRLKAVEKQLHDHVKKLDEALLALGEAASGESPAAIKVLPRVIEAMGQARADVGIDSSPRWDALVERIENGPAPVLVAAAAPAGAPAAPGAAAPAAPANGLAKAEYEGELSTVPAAQRAVAALLPLDDVPAGWELGDLGGRHLETFNGENLYEKIDGRAESFVQYDVTGAAYANFHPEGDDSGEVQVYVFEFASPLKAFGKYGSEKPQDARTIAIGAEGYAAAGSVSFYQDQYFVQVVSTSDQPQYAEFSEAVARKVSSRIGGPQPATTQAAAGSNGATPAPAANADAKKPATPAEMFALLPGEPGRQNLQYVAQDAFGYSFLSNVFLADYKEGEATWQGFLRPFATPEEAKAVFEKYVDAAKADGAEIKEAEAEGAERMVVSSVFGLTDVIFLKGNAVAGANGATQPGPAEAFAKKLAQSLPSAVPTIGEESKTPAPGEGSGGEY